MNRRRRHALGLPRTRWLGATFAIIAIGAAAARVLTGADGPADAEATTSRADQLRSEYAKLAAPAQAPIAISDPPTDSGGQPERPRPYRPAGKPSPSGN